MYLSLKSGNFFWKYKNSTESEEDYTIIIRNKKYLNNTINAIGKEFIVTN